MAKAIEALTIQLLTFIGDGRRYGDVMEAWRTHCPRMTIWEDALIDGLVQIARLDGESRDHAQVTLTAAGHARLAAEAPPYLAKMSA